jgi:uncharacterized membrane protein YeaQ/YmgE (transglycosylase-associated protein family)
VNVYLAIVLAVPIVVAFASSARSRLALAVTVAVTWAVALYAYEHLVPDREETEPALMFFLVYIHLIVAPIAGTLASLLVPKSRGVVGPILAALVGSVAAVALEYFIPFVLGDDRVARAFDVLGPVVFAATSAVLISSITAKKPTANV